MTSRNDAFTILMTKRKKRKISPSQKSRPSYNHINRNGAAIGEDGSRFFYCPLGCGQHIAISSLNAHLDCCATANGSTSLPTSLTSTDVKTVATISERNVDIELGGRRTAEVDGAHKNANSTAATVSTSNCSIDTQGDIIRDGRENITKQRNELGKDSKIFRIMSNEMTQRNSGVNESVVPSITSGGGSTANNEITPGSKTRGNQCNSIDSSGDENGKIATMKVDPVANSIFSHMMKRSHEMFSNSLGSSSEYIEIKQRFHLHDLDGNLSWTVSDFDSSMDGNACAEDDRVVGTVVGISPHEGKTIRRRIDGFKWSSTVLIKKSKNCINNEKNDKALELSISSSIPPAQTRQKLVQRKSKLSVPVLKSILQKCVRRRRPMPAVRVAMELADKSWGDLIRRLPIIILEDSTLHPDFPLLIWLMVAESKNFIPPLPLVVRVMQIIFEVSSCPWKDDLSKFTTDDKMSPYHDHSTPLPLCSTSRLRLFDQEVDGLNDRCILIIRSILLRKKYGGMACDMKMLDDYIDVWTKRFHMKNVHEDIASWLFPQRSDSGKDNLKWENIPWMIYKDIRDQRSTKFVPPIIVGDSANKLEALTMTDISPSGIDFHCSNVLDSIISNDARLFSKIRHWLLLDSNKITERERGEVISTEIQLNENHSIGKEEVLKLLKKCMWDFSSGVNYRRPLWQPKYKQRVSNEISSQRRLALQDLWKDDVEKAVDSFVSMYLSSRLVS